MVKSPVRENRPPGSVRGAPGNRRPYRDPRSNSPRCLSQRHSPLTHRQSSRRETEQRVRLCRTKNSKGENVKRSGGRVSRSVEQEQTEKTEIRTSFSVSSVSSC